MILSLSTYVLYAYGIVPLAISLFHNRFQICPLIQCLPALVACVREPECKVALDCMAECNDATSTRRQRSADTFRHVQFPQDPSLCRYQCFDLIQTSTAEDFLECVGGSGCMEPTKYSDQCAPLQNHSDSLLPFEAVASNFAGQWEKLYTTGWDIWPCQTTEFHAPLSGFPEPKAWMTAWPHTPNVYRMDLNWTVGTSPHDYTFHMSNEIYPNQQWDFPSQPAIDKAMLKTRAVMWGTEAHENWYLLDYDAEMRTMIIHFCAYTKDIQGFDAMTMVLRKVVADEEEKEDPFTDKMAEIIEQRAMNILGEKFGHLQRIQECRSPLVNENNVV